jgi:hypothetical protein
MNAYRFVIFCSVYILDDVGLELSYVLTGAFKVQSYRRDFAVCTSVVQLLQNGHES